MVIVIPKHIIDIEKLKEGDYVQLKIVKIPKVFVKPEEEKQNEK